MRCPCAAVPRTRIVRTSRDPRPHRREQRPPARRALPGDVRDDHRCEELRSPAVAGREIRPFGRVDDQPVDDPHQLIESPSPSRAHHASGRTPASPRSAAAARSKRARTRGFPATSSSITSPQTARSPTGKQRSDKSAWSPSGSVRPGTRAACATDGVRPSQRASPRRPSAIPAAPRRCASSPTCADSAGRPRPPTPSAAAQAHARSPRS